MVFSSGQTQLTRFKDPAVKDAKVAEDERAIKDAKVVEDEKAGSSLMRKAMGSSSLMWKAMGSSSLMRKAMGSSSIMMKKCWAMGSSNSSMMRKDLKDLVLILSRSNNMMMELI
nr:hypothetical protein Iba_chr09aCG14570 [Ipomoea batatas]